MAQYTLPDQVKEDGCSPPERNEEPNIVHDEQFLKKVVPAEIKPSDVGFVNPEKEPPQDKPARFSILMPKQDDEHVSSNPDFFDKRVRTVFIRKIYCILSVRNEPKNSNLNFHQYHFSQFQFQCVLTLTFKLLFVHYNVIKELAEININLYLAVGTMSLLMSVNYFSPSVRRAPVLNLVLLGTLIFTLSFSVSVFDFNFDNVCIFVIIRFERKCKFATLF